MTRDSNRAPFQLLPCMDITREAGSIHILQQRYVAGTPSRPLEPLEQAQRFQEQGAQYLHVVDFDGARSGEPRNLEVVKALVAETSLHIEVGGGIRTLPAAEAYLAAGVWQVLLNTRALDLDFIQRFVAEFGTASLSIALDVKGERVVSHGWSVVHDVPAAGLGTQLAALGVQRFVTTDVDRDGSLRGPSLDRCLALRSAVGGSWVVSGGISRLEDVAQIVELGFAGAVIGRGLYSGEIDLPAALRIADHGRPPTN